MGAGFGSAFSNSITNPALQAMARGAAASAVTQGIGVVTGLQDKFSWAGVAAAGVGAGVGQVVGGKLGSFAKSSAFNSFVGKGITGGAAVIAAAAVQSALDGSAFGDNIASALPSMIGSLIGEGLASVAFKSPVQKAVLDRQTCGQARRSDVSHSQAEVVIVTAQRKTNFMSMARDFFGFDGQFGFNRRYDVSLSFATPFNGARFGTDFSVGRATTAQSGGPVAQTIARASLVQGLSAYGAGIGSTYQNRVNSGLGTIRAGSAMAQAYANDTSLRGAAMRAAGLAQSLSGVVEYSASPLLAATDVVLGRPARTLSGNTLPDTFMGDAAFTIAGAMSLRPSAAAQGIAVDVGTSANDFIGPLIGKSGFRTSADFADAIGTRYQGFVDDAYIVGSRLESQGLLTGNANTRFGDFVDRFSQRRMDTYLASEGIAEGPGKLIQLNRYLRDPTGSGLYVRPDVRVPSADRIFDATVGFKAFDSTQITRFGQFSGGNYITVVRPPAVGGSYSIVP